MNTLTATQIATLEDLGLFCLENYQMVAENGRAPSYEALLYTTEAVYVNRIDLEEIEETFLTDERFINEDMEECCICCGCC